MLYHVVCRECEAEHLHNDRFRAIRGKQKHATLHDHTVVVGEVEPAEP